MADDRRDYGELCRAIGALESSGKERGEQVSKLFELLRGLSDRLVTREDLAAFTTQLREHSTQDTSQFEWLGGLLTGKDGEDGVIDRLRDLEDGRDALKRTTWRIALAAVGLPGFAASCVAVWQWFKG